MATGAADAAGAAAAVVLDAVRGLGDVQCTDRGTYRACCSQLHVMHPICTVVGDAPHCAWFPLENFVINVTVSADHATMLISCRPEIDLPLVLECLLALLGAWCVLVCSACCHDPRRISRDEWYDAW